MPIPSRAYYTQPSGDVDDTIYLHTLLEDLEPLDDDGYAGALTRFPRPYDRSSGSPVTSTFTYGNVAASASGPPLIWEGTGTPTPNGTDVSDDPDSVTGSSAYRKAVWGYIVVDVTAPSYPGGETTMYIRAIDPAQPQPTNPPSGNDTGITATSNPAVMDSITLSRQSSVGL